MSKSAGPSAYPTKASNQVENVLEARGLGLQLFSKGLLEKNRDGQDLPHLLATRSSFRHRVLAWSCSQRPNYHFSLFLRRGSHH